MADDDAGAAGPARRPRLHDDDAREAIATRRYDRPLGAWRGAGASKPKDPAGPPSAGEHSGRASEPQPLRSEVATFIERLREYGIGLEDLVALTPRRTADRYRAVSAARTVIRDPDLSWHLFTQHELPTDLLQRRTDLGLPWLELRRKYITALALLLRPEFPGLQAHLSSRLLYGPAGQGFRSWLP